MIIALLKIKMIIVLLKIIKIIINIIKIIIEIIPRFWIYKFASNPKFINTPLKACLEFKV